MRIYCKLFINTFGWKLRDVNERTPLRNEKDRIKNQEQQTEAKNEKNNTILRVEKILNRISREKTKRKYSANSYWQLKFALAKTKYILDINWYVNEDDFEETIIKMSNKYWLKRTVQAVNNILKKETNKIWNIKTINLNPWRIVELKKSRQ